jgi:hypothetical protein
MKSKGWVGDGYTFTHQSLPKNAPSGARNSEGFNPLHNLKSLDRPFLVLHGAGILASPFRLHFQ